MTSTPISGRRERHGRSVLASITWLWLAAGSPDPCRAGLEVMAAHGLETGSWGGMDLVAMTAPAECPLACPSGAVPESEPCGLNTNGGCSSTPPAFEPIACGETICGTAWANNGVGDTDWYQVVITSDTELTWAVEAEFPVLIGFMETNPTGSDDCADATGPLNPSATGAACQQVAVSTCVPPGTYRVFLAPQDTAGLPCGGGNAYTAQLTCRPCFIPTGACCLNDLTCQERAQSQCTGNYLGDDTTCNPNPCQQPTPGDTCDAPLVVPLPQALPYADSNHTCGRFNNYGGETCLTGFAGGEDIIYELDVTAAVAVNILLDPHDTTYTGMAIGTACPLTDSCFDASASDAARPHGLQCLFLEPGTYYLMIDTWPPPSCIADFALTITECAPCPALSCPPGAVAEPEPCGADTNGGCYTTPHTYTPIGCRDAICGTSWADNGVRDTDWYTVDVPDPGGQGHTEIIWTVESQFPSAMSILNDQCGTSRRVFASGFGDCGQPTSIQATVPAPGTYRLLVTIGTPQSGIYTGWPCTRHSNDYMASVYCTGSPEVTAAVSRKNHGPAGSFDIDVSHDIAVEDRREGPTRVIVTFDRPIQQVTGTCADVQLSSGTVIGLSINGQELTIEMTGVSDKAKLLIQFPGIADARSRFYPSIDTACFGVLAGDVTADQVVNVIDLVTIRNNLNLIADADRFRCDVTADSQINIFDLVITRNNLDQNISGSCP